MEKKPLNGKKGARAAKSVVQEINKVPEDFAIEKGVVDTNIIDAHDLDDNISIEGYPYTSSGYKNSAEYATTSSVKGTILPSSRFSKKYYKKAKTTTAMLLEEADRFEVDPEHGLSLDQIENRTKKGLVNKTKKKSSKSLGRIFFQNIITPINMIAVAVSVTLGIFGGMSAQQFFMLIILINTGIGIFQEIRAKRTVEKLSILTAPTATVIRNGEKMVIPIAEVVLDDVLYLESGKQICADSVVLKGEAEANEALLTGESIPVRKLAGSELYSGSYLSAGACYAKVNKVGETNYVETLTSHAKKYKKPKSELFNSIHFLIKIIIPVAVVLTIATLALHYAMNIRNILPGTLINVNGEYVDAILHGWRVNIEHAAGIMVGMLPVGMFLLTSTALFVSVIRLGKKRALVKDFNCIEMLARADVLCLDKTGTITDGSMRLKETVDVSQGATEQSPYTIAEIVGSILTATGDNNQTARALAQEYGFSKTLAPTEVLPFSSARKFAAVTFGEVGTYLYGAPEFVLREMGIRLERKIGEYTKQGYRVLVLAHSPGSIIGDKLPQNRKALAVFVIEDNIRDDAIETIKWFKENNVSVKVISGDNAVTVSEIAKRVGIENSEIYISLEGLSEREVLEAATKYSVFGRVSPEQKKLLVQGLKAKGHTVAMTGDGVNDILAMRESDCAIAIASGAEAARGIAHLVLQDSNFSSMPQVVMEGRRVVNNIQKTSALFLMKTIMTALLAVVFLFMESEYPYRTHYLLLMEIFVIAAASFALAMQANTKIIRGKFLSNVIGRSAPGGVTLAVSMIAIYLFMSLTTGYVSNPEVVAQTYRTMVILGVTFTSFIVLIKICEPLNMYRIVMLVVIGVFLGVAALVLPLVGMGALLGIYLPLELHQILFLIATVLGAYFFMSIFIRIMRALKILHY